MKLAEARPITDENLKKIKELQYTVSTTEEYISKYDIVGIKEAVKRVTGYGTMEGGRLPIKGKLPDGEWEKWSETRERIQKMEDSLSEKNSQYYSRHTTINARVRDVSHYCKLLCDCLRPTVFVSIWTTDRPP